MQAVNLCEQFPISFGGGGGRAKFAFPGHIPDLVIFYHV